MLARWLLPNPYTVQHRILGLLYERVHLDEYLAGQNDIAAALNLPADKTIRHLNALRVGGYAQPDYEGNWMITEQGQRAHTNELLLHEAYSLVSPRYSLYISVVALAVAVATAISGSI